MECRREITFINREAQNVAINRGDATRFVILGVSRNAFVDLRQVRIIPSISGWANARTLGFADRIPRILLFFPGYRRRAGRARNDIAALPGAPLAACPCYFAQVRHQIGDLDARRGRPRCRD